MGETCPLDDGCGCADFIIKKTLPTLSSADDDDVIIMDDDDEASGGPHARKRKRRTRATQEEEEEKSCIFPLGQYYGGIYPPDTPGTDCDVLFAVGRYR